MYKRNASILIFSLGFATACISAGSKQVQSGRTGSGTAAAQNQNGPSKIVFKSAVMGEMRDEDGVHLGFTNFKASDGSGLTVLYEGFGSPAKALNYFEKQLAKAAKVIERKNKLNPEGKVIGERAEILSRLDPQKTIPAVLWTDGENFHEIYSSSLKNILELERVYKY